MNSNSEYVCVNCLGDAARCKYRIQKIFEDLARKHREGYDHLRLSFLKGVEAAAKVYEVLGMVKEADFNPDYNQWGEKPRVNSLKKSLEQELNKIRKILNQPEETWVDKVV